MSRSRFSNYNRRIKMLLARDYDWDVDESTKWLQDNRPFVHAMYRSASPTGYTTKLIAVELKLERKN